MAGVKGNHSFTCDKCNFTAKNGRDLTRHVKAVHRRVKDNICDVCERGFATESYLRKHEKNMHGRNEDDYGFKCDLCLFTAKVSSG